MRIRMLDVTTIKFLAVGVINTLVGSAIMFGCYNALGLSYWVSSATNYILTSILSYFLNKYFTFRNRERSWRQVFRFVINIAVCYILAYGMAKPAVQWLLAAYAPNIQENVSMLTGMCLFTGFNYLGQRFFAFRSQRFSDYHK